MRGRGALASRGHAPFQEDKWFAAGHAPDPLEEASSVGDALDVRERHRRRVVSREVFEEIGHRDCGCVPGRDRAAHTDARLHGVVLERRHEVAGLAHDRDAARRRVRRHDLRAQRRRRRDDALAIRPHEQQAEVASQRDELALRRPSVLAGLAVSRRRDEGGLDALRHARLEQVDVGGGRRAHEDEVGGTLG